MAILRSTLLRPRLLLPRLVAKNILVTRGGPAPANGELSATLDDFTLTSAGTRQNSAVIVTSGVNTNGAGNIGSSQATSSITPAANVVIYAAVYSAATSVATPTATGNSLTYVAVDNIAISTTRRLTVFRALGASPAAGAITFDFGGQNQNSAAWIVVACPGSDATGTNGSGATVQAVKQAPGAAGVTLTNTLAALGSANNIHLAFIGTRANGHTTIAHDADFAELADVNTTSDGLVLEAQWARNQVDCTPTWGASDSSCALSVEVKSA